MRGYKADLTIDYQFAAIEGSADVTIPLSISWPFVLGPIPMYVSMKVDLSMESTLTATDDVGSGSVHFVYTGDFGVNRTGTATFTPTGGILSPSFDLTDAAESAQVTAGVEALLEAPTIALGVGVPSASTLFDANVYFKVKSEVTSNLTIPDPFAAGTPSCLQVSCGTGAYYGGSLSLFGVQVAQEQPISEVSRVIAQSGDACQ